MTLSRRRWLPWFVDSEDHRWHLEACSFFHPPPPRATSLKYNVDGSLPPNKVSSTGTKIKIYARSTPPIFFFFLSPQGGGGGSIGRTVAPMMMASPLPETPDSPPTTEEQRPALVYGESAARSFVKALVWRLTAGVVTLVRRAERRGWWWRSSMLCCKCTTAVVGGGIFGCGDHALSRILRKGTAEHGSSSSPPEKERSNADSTTDSINNNINCSVCLL